MNESETLDVLVESAIENDELHELILGKPGYEYLPKFSPSSWETDQPTVLTRLAARCSDPQIAQQVSRSIRELAQTYEGVVPAAICYLFESVARRKNGARLGLELAELGPLIRATAAAHREELETDSTGPGAEWPDGLYGELRHLNTTCIELGGEGYMNHG